jgi:hypothetical protein
MSQVGLTRELPFLHTGEVCRRHLFVVMLLSPALQYMDATDFNFLSGQCKWLIGAKNVIDYGVCG